MIKGIDAEPLELPVAWQSSATFFVLPPKGWADEHLGPPGYDDPEGQGLGHETGWALRFSCGLECLLVLYRQHPNKERDVIEVSLPLPETDHALRHLELPPQTEVQREKLARAPTELWAVWRQDDNGNVFLMEEGLSQLNAECLATTFERRGHKQLYWAGSLAPQGSAV